MLDWEEYWSLGGLKGLLRVPGILRRATLNRPGRTPSALAAFAPILPLLLAALALSALGGRDAIVEGLAVVAAIAGSFGLRRAGAEEHAVLWILPAALAVGGVAALASPSLTSEFLAAFAGLSLLFWISVPTSRRASILRPSAGLLLPGASVLLALLVTQVLPGETAARLGVASALLVLVLLAFGLAIRRPDCGGRDGGSLMSG